MSSLKEISIKYAELIINSKDTMDAISSVQENIDKLIYTSNGNYISEEDKEKIWNEIESILRQVENNNSKALYEQSNVKTLDLLNQYRKKGKKKK